MPAEERFEKTKSYSRTESKLSEAAYHLLQEFHVLIVRTPHYLVLVPYNAYFISLKIV